MAGRPVQEGHSRRQITLPDETWEAIEEMGHDLNMSLDKTVRVIFACVPDMASELLVEKIEAAHDLGAIQVSVDVFLASLNSD